MTEFSLPHGRREIELKTIETTDGYNVRVQVDDQPVIEVSQPHVWTKERGAIGGVVKKKQSYQPARAGDAVSLYSIYYTEEKPSLIQQFSPKLAKELGLPANRIQGTLDLLLSDNTIPFIARYRKEATGGLDEVQIGQIQDRYQYLSDLEERRNVILNSIREQEKLTPELEKAILDAESKQILEDLYLPYKPKRRTRATIARELGLEPLSELILKQDSNQEILNEWIVEFNQSREEKIEEQKALQGAKDILAERISEDAELRKELRDLTSREGSLVSTVKPEFEGKSSKFEMYYVYEEKLSRIPPHRVLAMRRGEKDQVLKIQVKVAEAAVISLISKHWMKGRSPELRDLLLEIFDESYKRLLSGTIETDIRVDLKIQADTSSIDMFSKNLRQLMLQPPGGARNVLGLDLSLIHI